MASYFLWLIFLFVGFMPLRVTQKPKYSILVCPKKDPSILYLSPFLSVCLDLIPIYVHDMSSLILLRSKVHLCIHKKSNP